MSSSDIARQLGVSQPTVSRALGASKNILRIGRTRRARYALQRRLNDKDSSWNLYQIDKTGQAQVAATLHALHQGEFYLEPKGNNEDYAYLLNGEDHPHLFPDLPWFLDDMRPQGYLGRLLAHTHGPTLRIGTNPENWNIDEALTAILSHGNDTPGHFILGGQAIDTFLQAKSQSPFIDEADRRRSYELIAHNISEGDDLPNSSAGGEQPKLTACIRTSDDRFRHVIVKFSGSLQTDAGRRWADLLKAEAIASEELANIGLPSPLTEFVPTNQRTFLEVERFDRSGRHGRIPTLMLRTVLAGLGEPLDQSWTLSSQTLVQKSWLSQTDADHIATFDHFGRLIGNSDRHLGNLSLFLTPELPLKLCPIYDMLPMRYAPQRTGDLPTRPIEVHPPRPEELPTWIPAAQAAQRFWSRFIAEAHLFSDLRKTAQKNLDAITSTLDSVA